MYPRTINAKTPCQNVAEFLALVNDIRHRWGNPKVFAKGDGRQLWFRGQRSARWDLRPLIHRPQYVDAVESEIRLEFEGNSLQLTTSNLNRTKWESYFLMQHYGAPTRLLDWTGSPLAALYFAIAFDSKDADNDDAAVWMFDPWRWNKMHFKGLSGPALPGWKETEPYLQDLEDACDEERITKRWPIAIDPPSIDRRLASQTARFLLFGRTRDLVAAADTTDSKRKGGGRSRLAQIVISKGQLEQLRCELDDLGINQRVLFPDMQGLGTHLSWEWKSFAKKRRLY